MASPFTAKASSVMPCTDIIKQGRCTLVTTIQVSVTFKQGYQRIRRAVTHASCSVCCPLPAHSIAACFSSALPFQHHADVQDPGPAVLIHGVLAVCDVPARRENVGQAGNAQRDAHSVTVFLHQPGKAPREAVSGSTTPHHLQPLLFHFSAGPVQVGEQEYGCQALCS